MLKEVLIDRCLEGEPINDSLVVIAACNPYKLKGKFAEKMYTAGLRIE